MRQISDAHSLWDIYIRSWHDLTCPCQELWRSKCQVNSGNISAEQFLRSRRLGLILSMFDSALNTVFRRKNTPIAHEFILSLASAAPVVPAPHSYLEGQAVIFVPQTAIFSMINARLPILVVFHKDIVTISMQEITLPYGRQHVKVQCRPFSYCFDVWP
jgi:hypothetical protein